MDRKKVLVFIIVLICCTAGYLFYRESRSGHQLTYEEKVERGISYLNKKYGEKFEFASDVSSQMGFIARSTKTQLEFYVDCMDISKLGDNYIFQKTFNNNVPYLEGLAEKAFEAECRIKCYIIYGVFPERYDENTPFKDAIKSYATRGITPGIDLIIDSRDDSNRFTDIEEFRQLLKDEQLNLDFLLGYIKEGLFNKLDSKDFGGLEDTMEAKPSGIMYTSATTRMEEDYSFWCLFWKYTTRENFFINDEVDSKVYIDYDSVPETLNIGDEFKLIINNSLEGSSVRFRSNDTAVSVDEYGYVVVKDYSSYAKIEVDLLYVGQIIPYYSVELNINSKQ